MCDIIDVLLFTKKKNSIFYNNKFKYKFVGINIKLRNKFVYKIL